MPRKLNRREFVATGAAAGLAAAAQTRTSAQAPAMIRSSVKPVVVSSANGHQYKNGGTKTGVEIAFGMMTEGKDVLDALIAGVNLCELDPEDTSVGYGGLPNADGVVQLDASCMHGPKKRAGARGLHRGRPHAVARRPEGPERYRPSPAGRPGRPALRAHHGLQDRRGPQHRSVARRVAGVEAPHRSRALPRPGQARGSRSAASSAR